MNIIQQLEKRKKLLKILNSPSNSEVYTPIELVEEMLDKLPKDIWKNPNLTWCDPCAKSGVFILEVIIRLMKNLEIGDETFKYNHIINNMVKAYINVDRNKWIVSKMVYGSTSKINRIELLEIDKIKKEDMPKFDVVVGNPPFNAPKTNNNKSRSKLLYPKFVELSHKISAQYSMMVIPFRWSKIESLKDFRKKMFHDFNISYIEVLDNKQINQFENIALASGMCFYISNKHNTTSSIINIQDSGSIIKFNVNENEIYINNPIVYKILDKIKSKCKDNMSNHYNRPQWIKSNDRRLTLKKINMDDIKVMKAKNKLAFINKSSLGNKLKNYNLQSFKLILPMVYGVWKKFGFCKSSMFILEKNIATTESLIFFSFSSKKEAKNCKNYILSKFSIALNHIVQIDKTFSPSSFIYMPYVDFSRSWTDQELYEYFNLTQEEIDYIESQVK